jgi:hypothetical protein
MIVGSMRPRQAFVDTDVFLHCRPLRELPWLRLLAAESVELFIAPVVFRQLDRHKDQHPVEKLRKRARGAVSRIQHDLGDSGSGDIAPLVRLTIVHDDPRIDFAAAYLQERSEDDQLIATMLQHSHQTGLPAAEVTLVTNDYLLRQKARAHGFATLKPPDDAQLPDAPTDEEKRLRELEAENYRLTHSAPKLEVRFDNGQSRIAESLRLLGPLTTEEGSEYLASVRRKHPPLKAVEGEPASGDRQNGDVVLDTMDRLRALGAAMDREFAKERNEAVKNYNDALIRFYAESADYFERLYKHRQTLSRSVAFKLVVANTGAAPATDIDVHLTCDAALAVRYKDKGLRAPRAPKPPEVPDQNPFASKFSGYPTWDLLPTALSSMSFHGPEAGVITGPWVDVKQLAKGFEITLSIKKLKHTLTEEFGPFRILFPRDEDIRPFEITYSINSGNVPENACGSLHVIPTVTQNPQDADS